MIGRLRGKVWERTPQRIILDVGGVGYVVNVTTQVALRPGEQADLHVHTAVRDDAITLFGFATAEEKDLFDLQTPSSDVGLHARSHGSSDKTQKGIENAKYIPTHID